MLYKIILCVLSGILTGLSFNSSCLSFLVWFSLVPFFYVIAKSRAKKDCVLSGAFFGFAYYGTAIFWVAEVTKLGFVFLLFYLCVYYVLFFPFARRLLNKPMRIVSIPALWVVLEFLKENIWCGFGWANLGYSQFRNLYFIQTADLFGVKFISFLIVAVNVLIWEALFSQRIKANPVRKFGKGFEPLPDSSSFNSFLKGGVFSNRVNKKKFKAILERAVFTVFIFGLCFCYSTFKLNRLSSRENACSSCANSLPGHESNSLKAALIQPNISQRLKWESSFAPVIINRLRDLSLNTERGSLLIFPEAAWPHILDKHNFSEIEDFAKSVKRDILIGAVTREEDLYYNSALLFDKSGRLISSYRKIKLVPFGEYVPLRKVLSFISVFNSLGDMSPGKEKLRFFYKRKSFSVLICFEDISPIHVVHFSRDNHFLVNITNDAWFGGEPEAGQHLGIMVFRAVENRVPIARCANTGISGWVSPSGEIEKLEIGGKGVFVEGAKEFEVPLRKERSFYNKYPYVFVIVCGLFLFCCAILRPSKELLRKFGNKL